MNEPYGIKNPSGKLAEMPAPGPLLLFHSLNDAKEYGKWISLPADWSIVVVTAEEQARYRSIANWTSDDKLRYIEFTLNEK